MLCAVSLLVFRKSALSRPVMRLYRLEMEVAVGYDEVAAKGGKPIRDAHMISSETRRKGARPLTREQGVRRLRPGPISSTCHASQQPPRARKLG